MVHLNKVHIIYIVHGTSKQSTYYLYCNGTSKQSTYIYCTWYILTKNIYMLYMVHLKPVQYTINK